MKAVSLKALLALFVAGSLVACATPESRNQITVTTNDGQQIQLEDTSIPSTANDAIVMSKMGPTE